LPQDSKLATKGQKVTITEIKLK